MQLIILIMVNILIASVFYLVISLKLERSATEFRSKRLRKEMEELINEFNNTAERNLSLLEYKINILRELLKRGDALNGIDITIDDENVQPLSAEKSKTKSHNRKNNLTAETKNTGKKHDAIIADIINQRNVVNEMQSDFNNEKSINKQNNIESPIMEGNSAIPSVKEQLLELSRIIVARIKEYIKYKYKKNVAMKDLSDVHYHEMQDMSTTSFQSDSYILEESMTKTSEEDTSNVDETVLQQMYENADDKYLFIAKLYSRGYTLQMLSKISGITISEISLILNLSTKQ
ncbi:MAG: hypothetical protein KBG92_07805 [Spirochaetes bacterium]|nr:hypothetical protein [Spirochaetota bacterium]